MTDKTMDQWLAELQALRPGDPIPDPPPDRRHPLQVLDDERADELGRTVAGNIRAVAEGHPEDVEPTGWLIETLTGPEPRR